MSVDKVSQTRKIEGFEVRATRRGPMGLIASKVIDKEIKVFLDRLERLLSMDRINKALKEEKGIIRQAELDEFDNDGEDNREV